MSITAFRLARALTVVALVLPLVGCEDQIIYRDRELFEQPENAAAGFLGYADQEDGLTVCGQCHVSFQTKWSETKHAHAWASLDASGAAQPLCEGCHTTNSRGNIVEGLVGGYLGHEDERYFDVQCEACHGPGLEHVTAPSRENWPLATLAVGTDLQKGCGECHSGAHQPFVEQWASSRHAVANPYPAGNPSCQGCHRGQTVLKTWGVQTRYLEADSATHLATTCGVCHDPHDATNSAQLRFPIDVANEEQNLCMKCHHKRGTPDPTTFRGPHSPEGPVLLGVAGWWPPNIEFQPGEIVATHGSEANPRLCAGCHVNRYEIRDEISNQLIFRSTGHTFEAIPCVDAQGLPTGDAECDVGQRTFRTCAQSGCHGSEATARSLLLVIRDRISTLAASLQSMEAAIPATEFNDKDTRYSTAEGARFNRELAQYKGSEVHNPWLIEALLRASMRQVNTDYGVPIPAGVSLEQKLGPR